MALLACFFCCGLGSVICLLVLCFCLWSLYLVWSFSPSKLDPFLVSCLVSSLSLSLSLSLSFSLSLSLSFLVGFFVGDVVSPLSQVLRR